MRATDSLPPCRVRASRRRLVLELLSHPAIPLATVITGILLGLLLSGHAPG